MAKRTAKPLQSGTTSNRRPALTTEARENELIALSYDLAEQRLLDGTASAQEVTHFLKLGSSKERLEQEILAKQKILIEAKTENLQSVKRMEELYADALASFCDYSGKGKNDD